MIKMNDFAGEPEELLQEQISAVEKVLRSGWYVLGPEVKNFEKLWAENCLVNHAVGVANGMEALEIGLLSLNLQPDDEIITTPMTAFATVLAIIRAGAVPVLADIDPQTGLLDPDSVERCISPKTKAILLVHLYGQIRQMDRWQDLYQHYNLTLLEDCAQCHLATWQGQAGGSFGIWGAYSFYPTKNLGAIGDAGALVTNDLAIAQQAIILRNYGQTQRYHHPEIGLNSRLDELQAALLSVRLKWLAEFTQQRKYIANCYLTKITNPKITLLDPPQDQENHVYHLFVIKTDQRERLMEHLNKSEINNLSHYPIPIHHQEPCLGIRTDPQGLKYAEIHADQCLSLPCHPQMTDPQILRVIEVINEY
ncbi:DegT/DnrJ/EryC1/StrS family aminotransferase [Synechocystis sp. LKSZ1]|uniref:DegT/DnrJ/EryC1/StrS family aminotransferase n=1 Tax=Synechocystis sp. LKSZ1 TaxID=3144951 RepID=UPI00336C1E83